MTYEELETARLNGATIYAIANDGRRHIVGTLHQKPEYSCPADRYEAMVPYALATIAELGQEVGAVGDEWIDIPKAQALIAAVGPGYRVIYRDAFRWKDERGHILSNHYEMFSAPGLCADFGHELILDLGNAAILRDKRTSPAHTSEARDAELLEAAKVMRHLLAHIDNEFPSGWGWERLDNALSDAAMRQEGGNA